MANVKGRREKMKEELLKLQVSSGSAATRQRKRLAPDYRLQTGFQFQQKSFDFLQRLDHCKFLPCLPGSILRIVLF